MLVVKYILSNMTLSASCCKTCKQSGTARIRMFASHWPLALSEVNVMIAGTSADISPSRAFRRWARRGRGGESGTVATMWELFQNIHICLHLHNFWSQMLNLFILIVLLHSYGKMLQLGVRFLKHLDSARISNHGTPDSSVNIEWDDCISAGNFAWCLRKVPCRLCVDRVNQNRSSAFHQGWLFASKKTCGMSVN